MEELEKEVKKPKSVSKKCRKNKKLVRIMVVVAVICLCVALYCVNGCRKSTVDDVFTFENNANYQISEYNGKILTVSYDGIRFLNVDGTQSDMVENHMSNPHYNISGNMILLYDKGGNHLAVYDGTTKKYSYENDQPIRSAKVNKNGYVVLISDEIAYNAKVVVVNSRGEEEYLWKIGDEFIVDADISADSSKIVAASITTDTGAIVENIVFVDIDEAKEIGRAKNEGDMPLQVEFAESRSAIVMSDNKVSGYDTRAQKKWSNDFDSNLLSSYAIDEEGNSVVALKGIKNNSIIRTYTKNGSDSGEYTTETEVLYIDQNNKNIAVCEKNKVSLLNYSCKVMSEIDIKKKVTDISVINANKVILLCDDSIQLIKG